MAGAPFISLPIYTAATTTASPPPTIPSPATTTTTTTPPTPKYSTGPTCFRLLCHASLIGGIIGKSGSIIRQLQQSTSSKIRIEDSPPGSDDRVICIFADSTVNKTMSFTNEDTNNSNVVKNDEESLYSEVSAAQEALVRVYERVLSVAAEAEGDYFAPGGVVSCRLLTDTVYVKFVIGKGGKNVEKIRKDTGCKIRIFGQHSLPSCAMPNDEMILIEGDILAIKKALIAVARCLQDSPPSDKVWMSCGKPHNGFNRVPSFPNGFNWQPSIPNGFNQEATLPNGFNQEHTLPNGYMDAETFPSMDFRNSQGLYQIVFRILCSGERIGGVIGNSGTIVQALENESGARISVAPSTHGCDERLITITSMESPESQNSPAQNAVILVFNRSVEAGYEKGLDSPSSRMPISARLLIPHYQMGCLLGKCGSIMSDMRKVTGAYIKIVGGYEVPRCASETDRVVLMNGGFVNVRDALYGVTSRLRNYLFSSRMSNGPNMNTQSLGQPSFGVHPSTHHVNELTNLTQSMDNLRLVSNVDHPSSSGPRESQGGDRNMVNGHFKGGIELGRGSRSAIVTSTTVEIMLPKNVIGSVYGENGSNLIRLREISGAKVVVHESGSGLTDHVIVISGTPDETQSAQSLLQAFILTDQH